MEHAGVALDVSDLNKKILTAKLSTRIRVIAFSAGAITGNHGRSV